MNNNKYITFVKVNITYLLCLRKLIKNLVKVYTLHTKNVSLITKLLQLYNTRN